jgi:hypothetical protein
MGVRIKALVTFDMETNEPSAAMEIIDIAMFEMFKRNKDQIDKISFDWRKN